MVIGTFRTIARCVRRAPSTAICALLAVLVGMSITSPLTAQGGMGGMGGGGMGGGGRGGGRGRGGMGGGGMDGDRMKSPAETVKAHLEQNDPLKFLLDRKKPLSLSGTQRDTIKRYQQEMEDAQRPVFKALDKLSSSMPGRGGMGAGGRGRGGDGERGGAGGDEADGRDRRGGPGDTIRVLADKLTDIQDSFRDRARGQLDAIQKITADSLETLWLAELRKKDDGEREKRRNNRRD